MLRLFASVFVGALLILTTDTRSAHAILIEEIPYEKIVLQADFVGIVECVQAGGIVAKYKVVESWKGPRPGALITIKTSTGSSANRPRTGPGTGICGNTTEQELRQMFPPGSSFPITLCGERFLVTAFQSNSPINSHIATFNNTLPLWWRNLQADYYLPFLEDRYLLVPGYEQHLKFQYRKRIIESISGMGSPPTETSLLRVEVIWRLNRWINSPRLESDVKSRKIIHFRTRLAPCSTAEAFVKELLLIAKEEPENCPINIYAVLAKGGGEETLKSLNQLLREEWPGTLQQLDTVKFEIWQRLNQRELNSDQRIPESQEDPVTDQEAPKLRMQLHGDPPSKEFSETLTRLTHSRPALVCDFLMNYESPGEGWDRHNKAYVIASYFAWQCGSDRKQHFTRLLSAKDPYVRVTGATYLCFEDLEAGETALRKLTTLQGDAGVWAALTLARRGHKDAMRRALEVFREADPYPTDPRIFKPEGGHEYLQKQVVILLSNSAKAERLAPEDLPTREKLSYFDWINWWDRHYYSLVLRDPWLKILEEKKID